MVIFAAMFAPWPKGFRLSTDTAVGGTAAALRLWPSRRVTACTGRRKAQSGHGLGAVSNGMRRKAQSSDAWPKAERCGERHQKPRGVGPS